jgi:hypothetical protein
MSRSIYQSTTSDEVRGVDPGASARGYDEDDAASAPDEVGETLRVSLAERLRVASERRRPQRAARSVSGGLQYWKARLAVAARPAR